MIELEKLSKQNGSNRFGTCCSCCIGSKEDDSLIRIRMRSEYGQGVSICLCENCANHLADLLKDWSEEE